MKRNLVNVLIVLGVLVTVGGVAWRNSQRAPVAQPAAAVPAPSNEPAHSGVQPGELCPEPPPQSSAVATTGPNVGPATVVTTSPAPAALLPRVVDLGSDSCKSCKELAPILVELRKEYAGRVGVEFIDVWKDPEAGKPYKIRVIPTQIFFDRTGREVWRHEGFLPKAEFIAKFAELGVK